jgi:formamidopyrimidine-DNA glycosylase
VPKKSWNPMAELPDLEVISEYLSPRLTGVAIVAAQVRRPLVVRNLLGGDAASHIVGRRFTGMSRRGKYLLGPLDDGVTIVIHPMLAGRLLYGLPIGRQRKRDALVLELADGKELRYHDAKDMGKIYLTKDLHQVPGFSNLGPEATDPLLTLEIFRERIRVHRAEIKRVLTDQSFVAGIGNAYADEILWRARVYPMRRRPDLSPDDVARIHRAMHDALTESIEILRERIRSRTDVEIRDFLCVHGRTGEICPRCGGTISKVTRERRTTNFCRTCQPGLMVGRGKR